MARVRRLLALGAAMAGTSACHTKDAPPAPPARADAGPARAAVPAWSSNPLAGEALTGAGDSMVIETGPHTILWPASAQELAPPYTIRATFTKHRGRLHEGYGILFGGSGLQGPESGQVYSYLLVRGDGSFLVKRRQGLETPVVRDWTQNPVIRRDVDEQGRPNELEVAVTDSVTVFRVNGAEMARVPSAELSVRGIAGVRTSHECLLVVRDFRVEPGAADGAAR
ncbi:hypothetical protein [Longimicrobium sp.]|uniref:hypothetical protein n=1 Tax=Longimicrobium sp. TaxID=2029185 RepID=UPI002B604462|nr:hypothetical protein [Longimicrobium sp.]HSU14657.1 hypothetical protein [Longimicrobium sp.]